MVSAAERDPPVVAAALYHTVPLPLPLAPEVIVSHAALLVAVQAHPAALVTGTLPVPPPAGTLAVVVAIENAQPLPCVSVKVWPPMVSVPERDPPVVAAAVYWTVPLPLPLAPDVIVIHGALLVAVHAQPAAAVTATLPVPPAGATLALVGAIENEQPLSWLTVNGLAGNRQRARSRAAGRRRGGELHRAIAGAARARGDRQPGRAAARGPGTVRPGRHADAASPAAAGTLALVGAMANTQPLPCDTVMSAPATLIVPDARRARERRHSEGDCSAARA